MSSVQVKAKAALGTKDQVTAELMILASGACWRDLALDAKGKILVCTGKLDKAVLEKALALGVSGIIASEVDEAEMTQLERDLQSRWSPAVFALLLTGERIKASLTGKTATINVKDKMLVISE